MVSRRLSGQAAEGAVLFIEARYFMTAPVIQLRPVARVSK
jgi:hypothetical protein